MNVPPKLTGRQQIRLGTAGRKDFAHLGEHTHSHFRLQPEGSSGGQFLSLGIAQEKMGEQASLGLGDSSWVLGLRHSEIVCAFLVES